MDMSPSRCEHGMELHAYCEECELDAMPSCKHGTQPTEWCDECNEERELEDTGDGDEEIETLDSWTCRHNVAPGAICVPCEREAEEEAAYWANQCEHDNAAIEEFMARPIPEFALCPHGNKSHECNACYVASDLAYDANGEKGR
jgi:hypothetical protein